MDFFHLNKFDKVIIYGAGSLGLSYYQKLKDYFIVIAFLDQNADKIALPSDISVPCYKPTYEITPKNDITVIVCVHSGIIHCEIAENLYQYGYNRILFLPEITPCSNEETYNLRQKYCHFFEGSFSLLKQIPYYYYWKKNKKSFTPSVIRETANDVVVLTNIEILYTYVDTEEKTSGYLYYSDLPIASFKPYLDLFLYFMNGKEYPYDYINIYQKVQNTFSHSSLDEFLAERYEVYCYLEKEFQNNQSMLTYSPVDVIWNDKGYFNIQDGQHRAVYYYLRGLKKIPVRMSKDDYLKWINKRSLTEFAFFLQNKPDLIFFSPIFHPAFNSIKTIYENGTASVLSTIQKFIGALDLNSMSVLDASDYNSYFARFFSQMGVDKVVSYEQSEEKYQVACYLNELLYSNAIIEFNNSMEMNITEKYDILCILASFSVIKLERNIELLNKNINKMIIWETKENTEEEKTYILQNTKFTEYKLLRSYIRNNIYSEVGVFSC